MDESKIKDLGSVKLQAQYVSPKWKTLIKSILKAHADLESVKDGLDADEVEKFYRVARGVAYCRVQREVIQLTPIDGSDRLNVEFKEPYVHGFVTGRIQAIPGNVRLDSYVPEGHISVETVDLNHWQIKRGYCYLLADVNLEASIDYVKKKKFDSAMNHLCSALMQIGAASVRDPKEIEQMARTQTAKNGKASQDAKWEPLRKFALSLANEGNYPSRNQAVLAIKDKVLEKAKEIGVSMAHQSAGDRIDKWLSKLGYTPYASKNGTSASRRGSSAS